MTGRRREPSSREARFSRSLDLLWNGDEGPMVVVVRPAAAAGAQLRTPCGQWLAGHAPAAAAGGQAAWARIASRSSGSALIQASMTMRVRPSVRRNGSFARSRSVTR
jgi:hypothetical protein